MFGQFTPFAAWFGRVDGFVVPPFDGFVVPGAVDEPGAGLAAETAATPPPTRSKTESAAVMAARLRPEPFDSGATGSAGVSGAGAACASGACWTGPSGVKGAGKSCHSKVISFWSCGLFRSVDRS